MLKRSVKENGRPLCVCVGGGGGGGGGGGVEPQLPPQILKIY